MDAFEKGLFHPTPATNRRIADLGWANADDASGDYSVNPSFGSSLLNSTSTPTLTVPTTPSIDMSSGSSSGGSGDYSVSPYASNNWLNELSTPQVTLPANYESTKTSIGNMFNQSNINSAVNAGINGLLSKLLNNQKTAGTTTTTAPAATTQQPYMKTPVPMTTPPKDNTLLYVGIAGGGLLLVGVIILAVSKSKK